MQELNGYIKLYRKLIKWGWYQDSVVKSLFLHCLLMASFKDFDWMGQRLKAGQFVTSFRGLANDLGCSVQQIRTALNKLESTGEITSLSTNKYTIVTVINWSFYQSDEEKPTQTITNEQQTKNAVFCKQIMNEFENLKKSTQKVTNKKEFESLLNSGFTEIETILSTQFATNEQQTSNKQITNKQQHRKNNKNVKNVKKYNTRTREENYPNGYAGVKNLADD